MISVGNEKIEKVSAGADEIATAYVGEDKVYTSFTPYDIPLSSYTISSGTTVIGGGSPLPVKYNYSTSAKQYWFGGKSSEGAPASGKYRMDMTIHIKLTSPSDPLSAYEVLIGTGVGDNFDQHGTGEVTSVTFDSGSWYYLNLTATLFAPMSSSTIYIKITGEHKFETSSNVEAITACTLTRIG